MLNYIEEFRSQTKLAQGLRKRLLFAEEQVATKWCYSQTTQWLNLDSNFNAGEKRQPNQRLGKRDNLDQQKSWEIWGVDGTINNWKLEIQIKSKS